MTRTQPGWARRSSLQTSVPSRSGRPRSSTMRSTAPARGARQCRRARPLPDHVVGVAAEARRQHLADGGVVFDEKDPGGHVYLALPCAGWVGVSVPSPAVGSSHTPGQPCRLRSWKKSSTTCSSPGRARGRRRTCRRRGRARPGRTARTPPSGRRARVTRPLSTSPRVPVRKSRLPGELLGQVRRRVGLQAVLDVVDDVGRRRAGSPARGRAATRAAPPGGGRTTTARGRAGGRRRWRRRPGRWRGSAPPRWRAP